jgi:hypothetical protein
MIRALATSFKQKYAARRLIGTSMTSASLGLNEIPKISRWLRGLIISEGSRTIAGWNGIGT